MQRRDASRPGDGKRLVHSASMSVAILTVLRGREPSFRQNNADVDACCGGGDTTTRTMMMTTAGNSACLY